METINVSPFLFTLEGFIHEKATRKEFSFTWYSDLQGIMVKVEVVMLLNMKFELMPDIYKYQKKIAFKQYVWEWEASSGLKSGERVKWYSTSESGRFTYYWNESEAEDLEEVIPTLWLDHGKEENVQAKEKI